MIRYFLALGDKVFPTRQLLLRTGGEIRAIHFPGWLQASLLAVWLSSLAGVGYLVAANSQLHQALAQKAANFGAAVAAVRDDATTTVGNLQQQLADASQRYARTKAQYSEANSELADLRQQVAAATSEASTLQDKLGETQARAKALDDARAELERRLRSTEQVATTRIGAKLAQERDTEHKLQQALLDLQAARAKADEMKATAETRGQLLDRLAAERDRLRAQLASKLSTAAATNAAQPLQVAAVQDANGRPAAGDAGKPAPHAIRAAAGAEGELERLLASTGLDLDKLLGPLSFPQAQGGPYIALSGMKPAPVSAQRQAELQNLLKMLPLAAPLASYQVESGFGPRSDPFNGREAFHSGIDLAAPYRSPVYSTAPGIVVFTGSKEGYGRVVDINHGHGIMTRYAHLHRVLVAPGQKVAAHTEIGELGSTGRSTGPHVHYEIQVDGTPVDPAKFLQAGKDVVQIRATK